MLLWRNGRRAHEPTGMSKAATNNAERDHASNKNGRGELKPEVVLRCLQMGHSAAQITPSLTHRHTHTHRVYTHTHTHSPNIHVYKRIRLKCWWQIVATTYWLQDGSFVVVQGQHWQVPLISSTLQTRANVQLNNQNPPGKLLDEKEACYRHLLGSLLIWNCRNLENHPDAPCPACIDTCIWVRRSALKEQSVIYWMTRLITSKPTGLCLICLLLTNDSLLLIWLHCVAHPSMHLFTQQIPMSGPHEVRIEACRASLAYPLSKSVKWHPLNLLKIDSDLI